MITKEIEVQNKLGLHARAAAKLVHTAARFSSDVKVKKGEEEVDAKSILGVLLLAAPKGSTVVVTADGADEEDAVRSIEALFDSRFDEAE
ncbi:MAG: HPr family phosphocarrier protein [Thermoanaerobaculia bacterium]|nr:HPr family phosphocarrier protein [Thermoanaerobaculia bacterium]